MKTTKTSAIRELYYGNQPNYQNIPQSNEYAKALAETAEQEETLMTAFADFPALRSTFETFMESVRNTHELQLADCYAEGFRLGLALALDAQSA